jgi:hypothetical protein
MSEYDKSRKIANDTLEKGKAAAEQTARSVEQSYTATVENMRDYSLKMIDMAQANADAVFELARQLAAVKQPSDMVELWTAHAKKQFANRPRNCQRSDKRLRAKAPSRSRAASTRLSKKPLDRSVGRRRSHLPGVSTLGDQFCICKKVHCKDNVSRRGAFLW